MKKLNFILIGILSINAISQSYPPAAGQAGSTAIAHDSDLFVNWASGVEIERGLINIADPEAVDQGSNYATYGEPEVALGSADNNVVSLGDAGIAILTFDTPIGNGPGFDFAVFENAFNDTFLELAFVEVSSDGENYFRFPAHSETQTDTQVGGFGSVDPTYINNLAGKYRAQFGTPFDLDEIEDDPLLDKNQITHVKLIDAIGTIDPEFATYDAFGNIVNEPYPTPFWSSGFDLDAVGVINQFTMGTVEESLAHLKIYPNPTKNQFFIGIDDKAEVQILDTTGKIVSANSIENNQAIDVSNLEKGLYFIQIQVGKSKSLHKLIKK